MVLSITIPCMIKNNKEPVLTNVKKIFDANKAALLTSTIIIIITIYIACKINNNIDLSYFNNNDYTDFDNNKMIILRMNGNTNIKNFAGF